MFRILFLSLILSADALFFGFAFGINKIHIPLRSVIIMTLSGLVIILASICLGDIMYALVPHSKLIGSLLLIGTGIYIASDSSNAKSIKKFLSRPETTDTNHNGIIECKEAAAIGAVLSLDCSAVVIGTSYLGILLPFFILIAQLIFLLAGIYTGKKIRPDINNRYISVISGLIIIIIGFLQLN